MANLFSIQFEVLPPAGTDPAACFDAIQNHIADWVVEKYQRHWKVACNYPQPNESAQPSPGHSIRRAGTNLLSSALAKVKWTHPDDRDSSLNWITDVTVVRNEDKIQLAVQLSVTSSSYVVRPAWTPVGRPRVVTQILCQYPCWVGSQPLLSKKQEILAPDVAAFVHETLLNPSRMLPIVVVSHDRYSDRAIVDPDRMQQTLLGFAQVVVLDKWATFCLTDLLTKPLSCYNGAVRLYWPGLRPDSNPFDHPLYLPDALQAHEYSAKPIDKHLFYFLSKISAFRFADGDVIRWVQRLIDAERQGEIEKVRLQIQKGISDAASVRELEAEVERSWSENEDLRTRVRQQDEQIQELQQRLANVEANWAVFEEHQNAGGAQAGAPSQVASDLEFGTVIEALETAEREFAKGLIVYDSAKQSARRSQFARLGQVYQALEAIADVAGIYFDSLQSGESMGPWEEAFSKRGFNDYSPMESRQTMDMYGAQRRFTHDGKKREFQKHVTLGGGDRTDCIQIYFDVNEQQKRFEVAYCGPHLVYKKQRT